MLRTAALLLFICFSFLSAIACYNATHINKSGKVTTAQFPLNEFYDSPDKEGAKRFIARYDLTKLTTYSVDDQSDLAVNMAYLGEYDKALLILRRLQKENPGNYNVAANLGTTYELVGKNDSALLFIKKSIAINPESHNGTEWVHVKILEAKLNIAKHPDWLAKNSVLQTGVKANSPIDEILTKKANNVEYQLQERVPFTPFPDAILANVFNELGDLYATQLSIEHAYIAYDFALQYGAGEQYGTRQKMEELKPLLQKEKITIPSWRSYYAIRRVENDIKDVVKTTDTVVDGTKEIVSDVYTLNKERELEQERIKKRNNLLIGGAAFLIAVIGLGVWMKQRK
jgi:hypothetical protein